MKKYELYRNWLKAFENIGEHAIGLDTASRILAVTYVHGNNEAFVCNCKYIYDVEHIQRTYKVEGGETPDPELVELTNKFIKELEDYRNEHDEDISESGAIFKNKAPEWAHKLFLERYGIKLIN